MSSNCPLVQGWGSTEVQARPRHPGTSPTGREPDERILPPIVSRCQASGASGGYRGTLDCLAMVCSTSDDCSAGGAEAGAARAAGSPQRALAASCAIARRRSASSAAARALPPLSPPRRPAAISLILRSAFVSMFLSIARLIRCLSLFVFSVIYVTLFDEIMLDLMLEHDTMKLYGIQVSLNYGIVDSSRQESEMTYIYCDGIKVERCFTTSEIEDALQYWANHGVVTVVSATHCIQLA